MKFQVKEIIFCYVRINYYSLIKLHWKYKTKKTQSKYMKK